ncbi:MAG: hypothetical protein DELT_03204 [Desulfovibrio sp.]
MSNQTGTELSAKKSGKFGQVMAKPEMTALVALIALCIVMCILRPETFPTPTNVFNIMRQFSLTAILAVGMGLIIITTGIDLSVGSVIAASAAFGTYIARANEGTPGISCFSSFWASARAWALRTACWSPRLACRRSSLRSVR